MANFGKKTLNENGEPTKRWEKILALPDSIRVWDLSTGEIYKRGEFVPVFKDGFKEIVEYFQIKGTKNQVYVPFLRLLEDAQKCSLMKKGE